MPVAMASGLTEIDVAEGHGGDDVVGSAAWL